MLAVPARERPNLEGDSTKTGGGPTHVYGSVREARAAIFALGLSTELEERAALVVSELATNAVVHARGLLYVRIWYAHGCLRLEVADRSEVAPKPGPGPGSGAAMSGRGLMIVAALTKAWGWAPRDGGKVVWAELD